MSRMRSLLALSILAVPTVVNAQESSFQGLGDLSGGTFSSVALGVSDDASVVVGTSNGPNGLEAFRWTEGAGMVGLGDLAGGIVESHGHAVSANGAIVTGTGGAAEGPEAFRWTADGGMESLGVLAPNPSIHTSGGHGISADGLIIVGVSSNGNQDSEAFRWTAGGGMVGLGDLPGGFFDSAALDASASGSVVVGLGRNADNHMEAVRWVGSVASGLGDLPGQHVESQAYGVSADGNVVVGVGLAETSRHAFRWTAASGMVDINAAPFTLTIARAASGDGSIVIGEAQTPGGQRAFIWTAEDGMRDLRSVLITEYGLDLTGWTLRQGHDISPDGQAIVGVGINPQGQTEAWRVVLPPPCASVAWAEPVGGAFADPFRWAGGAVPDSTQTARFDAGDGTQSYVVTLGAPHTTAALAVERGDLTLALGGATYSLAGGGETAACGDPLRVSAGDGPAPSLTLTGGAVNVAGRLALEGPGADLTVLAGSLDASEVSSVTAEADSAAAPRLTAGDGAEFVLNDLNVGVDAGEAGVLDVRAGGAALLGDLLLGVSEGAGFARVQAEGGMLLTAAILGFFPGSEGQLRVEGSAVGPATLAVVDRIHVGVGGDGTLRVVRGGRLIGVPNDVVIGYEATGRGVLSASGTATEVALRYFEVGLRGTGDAFFTDGVTASAGRVTVGAFSGSEGALLVRDAGTFFAAERVAVGLGGSGALEVVAGGTATVGQLVVGPNGGVFSDGGTLVVGSGGPPARVAAGRAGGGGLTADTLLVYPGATLEVGGVALTAGGVLGGAGTLTFDLANAGVINPGDSAGVAGTFTIEGAYTQAPAGALEIELGGTAEGAYDRLTITGAATLEGTLRFSHIGGFTPAPGDAFDVLTAGSVAGAFATVEGPPGGTYSLAYGPTTVTATVLTVDDEPDPGAAGLVLHPPAPNPGAGRTTIRFELPAPGRVRLAVYDALGREVALLVNGERPAGAGEAMLEAGDLAPGAYVVRLAASAGAAARRFTVTR